MDECKPLGAGHGDGGGDAGCSAAVSPRRGARNMRFPRLIAEPFAFTNSFVGTEEYLAPEAGGH